MQPKKQVDKLKYYMHLIEGKPAFWSKDDGQIVYADTDQDRRILPTPLVRSRNILMKQQQLSRTFRQSHGFDILSYGYVIVEVPKLISKDNEKE